MLNIEEFMEWLNDEIEDLEMKSKSNYIISNGLNEARRIRAKLCQMDALNKTPDREELEDIAGKICKSYCVFPQAYGDREEDKARMIAEHCENCPLDKAVR